VLLIDDLFALPAKGVLWVIREVHQAASQEQSGEAGQIRSALRDLYLELERGAISEEVFASRESVLLDRLDELEPPE
jgi:hypothetical protein